MSRRGDPQPIYEAKLAGLHNRVRRQLHLSAKRANEVVDAWAAEAASRSLTPDQPRYWDEAWPWILEQTAER